MVEVKEALSLLPYTQPASAKCFKCNQPGNQSSDCPFRKAVHLVEREELEDNKVCCEPDEDGEEAEDYKDDDEG